MATQLLQASRQFANPYEQAKYNLSGSTYFDENLWNEKQKTGDLNEYITVISQAQKQLPMQEFNKIPEYQFLTGANRYSALVNELFEDRKKVKTFTDTYIDEYGQKQTKTFTGTQYEYNKSILQQLGEVQKQEWTRQREQEEKDKLSGFAKFMSSVTSVLGEFTYGMYDSIISVVDVPYEVFATTGLMLDGDSFEEAQKKLHTPGGEYDLRTILGDRAFRDALTDFERRYSSMLDIDDNSVGPWGLVVGAADSIGKMVPSMFLNLIPGAGPVASALYWTSLASSDYDELMNDQRLASVPAWQKMLNSSISATLEWGISKILSNFMGASLQDAAVNGWAVAEVTGKNALIRTAKRLGMDALHEGVEEVLQEIGDIMIDKGMSILNEQFGTISDFDIKTFFDAFIMAALTSLATGSFKVITTKRQQTLEPRKYRFDTKTHKAGDIVTTKDGKTVYKRMNMIDSFVYNMDLKQLMQHYNDVVTNKDVDYRDKFEAVTKMQALYRELTDFYGAVGHDRAVKAQKFLHQMFTNENNVSRALTAEEQATYLVGDIQKLQTAIRYKAGEFDNLTSKRLEKKLKAAGLMNDKGELFIEEIVDVVIIAETADKTQQEEIDKEFGNTLTELIKADPGIKKVAVSKKGTDIAVEGDTIIGPRKYLQTVNITELLKNISEKKLFNKMLETTSKNEHFSKILSDLADLFKKVTGKSDVDMSEVLTNLLFNNEFYRVALYSSYEQTFQFLSQLDNIINAASNKTIADAVFVKHLTEARESRKQILIEYITDQTAIKENILAELQQKNILTKKDIDNIKKNRWSKELSERIIKGEKLSDFDLRVIERRINSLKISDKDKQQLQSFLLSKNVSERTNAMIKLDALYNYTFMGPYNGKLLPMLDNIPNATFASWLVGKGWDFNTLRTARAGSTLHTEMITSGITPNADTAFDYVRQQFELSTNNTYTIVKKGQGFVAVEKTAREQYGYKRQFANYSDIYTGDNIEKRTFVNYHRDSHDSINNILNRNIDTQTKQFITLNDIIYDASLLNNDIQERIKKDYGDITPETTFLTLRNYLLEKTGTMSIVMLPNQRFALVDVKHMLDNLKTQKIEKSQFSEKGKLLSNYIKSDSLGEIGKKTVVKLGDADSYNASTNVIMLDKNASNAHMRFALLHEFQHVVQTENDMTVGISAQWLEKSSLKHSDKTKLITDVRKHRPDLYKGVKRGSQQELDITQRFVYDASGESQALGLESIHGVLDFIPVAVAYEGNYTVITMPWGTKYNISASPNALYYSPNNHTFDEVINKIKSSPNLYDYDSKKVRKGFIFPDGTIKFFASDKNLFEIHREWLLSLPENTNNYLAAIAFTNDALQITDDKVYVNEENEQQVTRGSGNYTVRMTSQISAWQTEPLLNFMTQAVEDGHTVTLADAHGTTLVTMGKGDYADEILKEYNKQKAYDRAYGSAQISSNYEYMFLGNNYQFTLSKFVDHLSDNYNVIVNKYPAFELNGVDIGEFTEVSEKGTHQIVILENGRMLYGNGEQTVDKAADAVRKKYNSNAITAIAYSSVGIDLVNGSIQIPKYMTNLQREMLASTLMKLYAESLPSDYIFEVYVIGADFYNNSIDITFDKIDELDINDISINGNRDFVSSKQMIFDVKAILHLDNDMSLAKQPADTRSKVKAFEAEENPNLKPFKNKLMDDNTKKFITDADPVRLAPELWAQINGDEAGTLTQQSIVRFLREANASDINDYTFELIRKNFFPNSPIENMSELTALLAEAPSLYALRSVISEVVDEDLLNKQLSQEGILNLLTAIENKGGKTTRTFLKAIEAYPSDRIDEQQARIIFMQMFDGSLNSAYNVAAKIRNETFANYKSRKEASTEATTATDKDGNTQTVLDKIGKMDEYNFDDEAEITTYELSNYSIKEKLDAIFNYKLQNTLKKAAKTGKQFKEEQILQVRKKFDALYKNADIDAIDAEFLVVLQKVSEGKASEISKEELEEATIKIRNRGAVVANIKRLTTTIRKNLTEKSMKLFKEKHAEIFDENNKVRKDLYFHKSKEELFAIEQELRELSSDVRQNAYISKKALAENQKLKRQLEKYKKKSEQNEKISKTKIEYIVLQDDTYEVKTTEQMPTVLKRILSTSLEKTAKSQTQFLTSADERHVKVSAKIFVEANAEALSTLTQGDVDAIIEFYDRAVVTGGLGETGMRKYDAFKIFTLTYIVEQANNGMFLLSDTQRTAIEKTLESTVSSSAQVLTAWRDAMHKLNPAKQLVQSLARRYGLEIDEADAEAMTYAIKSGDLNKLKAERERIYNKLLQTYKNKDKDIWSVLWKFQRMAMLSSPGTWVRNIASNVLVTTGNNLSSMLGNLLAGGKHKEGQYKIVGTKVDSVTSDFIKQVLIDSGFLASIADSSSKYDTRKIKSKTASDIVADMIIQNIASEIQYNNQFKQEHLNAISKWFMARLSDDKWVNKRAVYYMSRMLVEDKVDVSKFNKALIGQTETAKTKTVTETAIDLDTVEHGPVKKTFSKEVSALTAKEIKEQNKATDQVLTIIAEAYRMAAMDYMHKPNVFNKIEEVIMNKGGKATYFAYKQLLPFASASWNWFVEGLNYTPIGLAKGIIQLAKLEKTIENLEYRRQHGERVASSRFAEYIAKRNIGKGVIGSVAMGIGILLGALGIARIDDKDDKIKLFIGDNFAIDISSVFGTQGVFMGIPFGQLLGKQDITFMDALTSTFDAMLDDSIFTDLFNTFRYDQSLGEWLLSQPEDMLSSFVPNIWKMIMGTTYNVKLKYASGIEGVVQRLLVQMGGGISIAAFKIPTKIDPYTGKNITKYKVPFINDLINRLLPLKIYDYEITEYEKEALKLGMHKSELKGEYKDIGKFDKNEKNRLNEYYGKLNNKELDLLMSNKKKYFVENEKGQRIELTYNKMTDEQKKSVINRITAHNANLAKIYTWTASGHKYYASNTEFEELKSLDITSNVYKKTKAQEGFVK